MKLNEQDCYLTTARLSLLIGTMMGQTSELLNQMATKHVDLDAVYNSLLDITNMAALQIKELYYNGDKR